MTIHEYAKLTNKAYITVYRHYRKGLLKTKIKRLNGRSRILILGQLRSVKMGRPLEWTREKILKSVHEFCKDRYVPAREFPPYLYQLCISKRYGLGSVRAAKLEAGILHKKSWTYPDFITCVQQFCKKRYRENSDWPSNLRGLAKHFCRSIRKAKYEAGIISEARNKARRRELKDIWSKKDVLLWVANFCKDGYKKPIQWPGYMRYLAVLYFGSVREAKRQANILIDQRKERRTPSLN